MWIEFADSELEELLAASGALLRLEPMSTLHIGRGAGEPKRGRREQEQRESRETWHSAPVPMDRGDPTSMRRIDSPI